jgi:hypothetical protein
MDGCVEVQRINACQMYENARKKLPLKQIKMHREVVGQMGHHAR